MRITNVFAAAAAALAIAGAGSAAQADVVVSNTPTGTAVGTFGYPDSQTYGQVFMAPVSGTLTSFTLYLNGGVGSLVGGVADWGGTSAYSQGGGVTGLLYQSGAVASNAGGAYTFNANAEVVAGQLYVAYLSVFGLPTAGLGSTTMPLGTDAASLGYFVWNNSASPLSTSWNYYTDFGDAQFSATFSDGGVGSAVPEPATWAMMLIGFASLGSALRYSRRRAQAAVA